MDNSIQVLDPPPQKKNCQILRTKSVFKYNFEVLILEYSQFLLEANIVLHYILFDEVMSYFADSDN